MNEEFNLDPNHEVDDLFRDTLGGYSETPSDAAWSRLNKKLNYKEVHDFVTFKKPPAKSSGWPTPVYRMQWFRGIVAASVGAALVVSTILLVNNLNQEAQPSNQHLTDTNVVSDRQQMVQQPTPDTDPNAVATPYIPQLQNQTAPQSENRVPSNVNSGKNEQRNIVTNQSGNQTDTRTRDEANTLPVIADSNPHQVSNLPDLNQQPDQNQAQSYAGRYEDAGQVDSLIAAAIRQDSLQQLVNDYNPGANDDSTGEVSFYNPGQPNTSGYENNPIVANGFTPNGDGLNEYFYIYNLEKYPDNVLLIQDRKGRIVLDKKNYTGDWNAEGVPDGTYFYLFTYKDELGQKMSIQGVVYIIR